MPQSGGAVSIPTASDPQDCLHSPEWQEQHLLPSPGKGANESFGLQKVKLLDSTYLLFFLMTQRIASCRWK